MIINYKSGFYPTPMLAFYNEINKEAFLENKKFIIGDFLEKGEHYFNVNCYLIIENNKIKTFSIGEFSNFIYLLRAINKDLKIEINSDFLKLFKEELNLFKDELFI